MTPNFGVNEEKKTESSSQFLPVEDWSKEVNCILAGKPPCDPRWPPQVLKSPTAPHFQHVRLTPRYKGAVWFGLRMSGERTFRFF